MKPVIVLNFMGNKGGCACLENVVFTLNRMHGNDVHVVCYEDEDCTERRCEDDAEHNSTARSEGSPRQPGDRGGCPSVSSRRSVMAIASDATNAEICTDVSPTLLNRQYKGGVWVVYEDG